MKEYRLKTARKGLAAGEVFVVDADAVKHAEHDTPVRGTAARSTSTQGTSARSMPVQGTSARSTPARELARYEEAVRTLDQRLTAAGEGADENSASVFEAERMLLQDSSISGRVRSLILEENRDALTAVALAGEEAVLKLDGNENAYIRQRSEDVKGITERLAAILRGEEAHILREPSVIAAKELSPAQLTGLEPSKILGIITQNGAPASHVSVIAGNLGIPYFYGSAEAIKAVHTGSRVILDDGRLIVDPDEQAYLDARVRMREESAKERDAAISEDTDQELRIGVYANISGPQDIPALAASGAEGVGLFGTELLFLDHEKAASEEEQFEAYRSVAQAMRGKETVIRTMDLGSDKKPGWISLPDEKNPALGCRGLRLSMKEPALLRTQLRALLRAAVYGNIKIMVPMVTSAWEVDAVRAFMDECVKELAREGTPCKVPPLGIMVETPAAALSADRLAQKADFFSIGTNDLTQYTLALDREAEDLDEYYDPCHEAVLRLIEMTAAAARRNNISTCVCGELAADGEAVLKLIELGVDKLSVSISGIAAAKAAVRKAQEAVLQQKTNPRDAEIAAPADGRKIPMDEIPDPVFSSGTMGECVGILPENGDIYAPCDGIVSGIAQTKHAITFTAADGRQILVHAGIDTVTLGGRGFDVYVKEGASVSAGDPVMKMDLDAVRGAGLSTVIVTAVMPPGQT